MSRGLVAAGAVIAAGALAIAGLAAIGSAPSTTTSTAAGITGWTGRVDDISVSDKAAMTPDDAPAVALVSRAATAAGSQAYSGSAVSVERGARVVTQIVHIPGRGTILRAEGASKSTFAPDGRSGSFADVGRVLTLLAVNYRVLRQADLDTQVAGRTADAVVAVDAEGRVAARYWLDHATGLLLRRELVTRAGAVWSSTAFSHLSLGVPVDTAVPAQTTDVWGTPLAASGLASARAGGCPCPETLPGGFTLVDTRTSRPGTIAPSAVVHQMFSDGVVTVSLFSMPGALADSDAPGLTTRGFASATVGSTPVWVRGGTRAQSTYTVVWGSSGQVLTLVTDDSADPSAVGTAIVGALASTSPTSDTSFWSRVSRGLHRLLGRST